MTWQRAAALTIRQTNGFAPPDSNPEDEALRQGMHMADTKALFNQRFDAARTALSAGDEPAAAESLHSAIVVARTDPALRRELASALFHLGKLSRKFGKAGEAEAETLLSEALAISEALFGWEHAALAPLLNELSRLYVQRSQYGLAEEVLERLLAIARSKGEENADVATALAGLAVVKRKLGDDASAQTLFRDALRIREKVLEPSHIVTVVTLEQLSQTCAALGNFAEALTLLRRALATREVVLGPGHATAQAARSRVAELELQVAVAADTAAAAAAKAARGAMATPAWFNRVPDSPADMPSAHVPSPVDSKKFEFLGEPEPRVLRPIAPPARERSLTPTVTAAVAAASLMASPMKTPSASQIVIPPRETSRPESVTSRDAGALLADVVLADVARGDVGSDDVVAGDVQSAIEPVQADFLEPARRKPILLYASAAAVAVAIAGLLMLRPFGGGGGEPVSTQTTAQRTTAPNAPIATVPVAGAGSAATAAAAVVGATATDSLRSATAKSVATAPATQAEKREPESTPLELRAPRVEVNLGAVNIPNAAVPSITVAPSPDSNVRPVTAAGEKVSVAEPSDVENAVSPAKIIGRIPEPRFPDRLLRSGPREGQVLVRFMVNERGRVDVSSMIVERSNHEAFTDAVRDILPLFRFEPARTLAESKPVVAWVSVPFRFTTTKR